MARDVRVRLSAEIQAYLSAMQQAEQASTRVADAADRLGDISISADSSVASDLDQAASSADSASSSMENASGSAQGMSGDLTSAGASAQDSASGLDQAGASAQTFSGNLDGSGASAQDFSASLASVGAESQSVAASMLDASGAAQDHASILQGASGAMDGLSSSFAEGLSYSSGFSGSLMEASGHMGTFLQEAQGTTSEMRAMGGVLTTAAGGMLALGTAVLSTGIQYNSLQQVAGQALETMTGSAEDAAAQMERFDEFAQTSPFFRDSWLEAQRQLMAFGMEAERVVPAMEGIEEAVAAIGGGDQEIRQLVDILGQIEGQGQITGRELQRMGQMGIDAASLIGESMDMTGDEIREQITAGALDAETAITALTEGMSTRFEGSADAIRDTFDGATNDMIAAWRDLGSILAEPLVSADGGGLLVDVTNGVTDLIRGLNDVNPVILQVAGGLAAMAGTVGVLGGAWALLNPQIIAFYTGARNALTATATLGRNMVTTAGGMRRLAMSAGIAVGAIAALSVMRSAATSAEDLATSVSSMTQELLRATQGGEAFANVRWDRIRDLEGETQVGVTAINSLGDALERLEEGHWVDGPARFFDGLGIATSQAVELEENINSLDTAVQTAFQEGNFDQAAAGFDEITAASDELGLSADEVAEYFPQATDAIRDAATEAGHTASAQDILAVATNEAALAALQNGESWDTVARLVEQGAEASYDAEAAMDSSADAADRTRDSYSRMGEAAEEAAGGISDLVDDMNAMADIGRDARATEREQIANLQEVRSAIDDGSASLNRYTDEGQAGWEMIEGLAGSTMEAAAAQAAMGGSLEDVQGAIEDNIQGVMDYAEAAGLSQSEIEDLVRTVYEIPEDVPIDVWAEDRATDVFNEVDGAMDEMPEEIQIRLEGEDQNVQDLINSFRDGDYETVLDIIGDSTYAEDILQELQNGDYRAAMEIMAEMEEAQGALTALQEGDYQAWVDFFGDTEDADLALEALQQGDYQAFVDIIGDENAAVDIWNGFNDSFNGMPPTVIDMDGDPTSAYSVLHDVQNGDYSALMGIDATDGPARDVLNALQNGDYQALVDILGDDDLARAVMTAFENGDYSAMADLLANDDSARGTVGTFTATQWQTTIEALAATAGAEGDLNQAARDRDTSVIAIANTYNAETQLNDTARTRNVTFNAVMGGVMGNFLSNNSGGGVASSGDGSILMGGLAHGGRAGVGTGLQAYASGGRLPSTGLGTDQILGISSMGHPTAWVDDREWIINRKSSDRYDGLLQAINQDDPYGIKRYASQLSGYAAGGRTGYQGQVREFSQPSAPRVTVQAPQGGNSGRNVTINNTTNYPVREKTSRSQQRGAAMAGMGFDPDEMGG